MLVSLVITMTIKDNQIVFDRVYPKSVLFSTISIIRKIVPPLLLTHLNPGCNSNSLYTSRKKPVRMNYVNKKYLKL